MLSELHTTGLGPLSRLDVEFGRRYNLITGDNGLGKSFLLETAFWALTQLSPDGRPPRPYPPVPHISQPTIGLKVCNPADGKMTSAEWTLDPQFDFLPAASCKSGTPTGRVVSPGFVLYASCDMGISIAHTTMGPAKNSKSCLPEYRKRLNFKANDILHGLSRAADSKADSPLVCRGIINDWAQWSEAKQGTPSANRFAALVTAIEHLFDPDDNVSVCSAERISAEDAQLYPILKMPSGKSPFPHWSSSMKRMALLAYIMVWAWADHEESCRFLGVESTRTASIFIDEIEAHLHPTWQRRVLLALQGTLEKLVPGIQLQIIATTHSPLVLASAEPFFDPAIDRLFHFESDPKTGSVQFDNVPWFRAGDADAWLTSRVFGLKQSMSLQAEEALSAANRFLLKDTTGLPNGLKTRAEIDSKLKQSLPPGHWFWPRWELGRQ